MADVRIQCCDVCGRPLSHYDARSREQRDHTRKEGLKIELGYSRGGWGRRQDWLDFSGEVCGECFDAAGALLQPIIDFIRNRGERPSDQAAVRPSELAPEGRRKSLRGVLRALPSGRGTNG